MKSYYPFLKKNYREVGFGGILTFFSSFGQTFIISLYVPSILVAFNISKGLFGTYYAIGTLVASVILLTIGHAIDHQPVRRVTNYTIAGLSISAILLGISFNPILLIVALTGLRLTGQGLMGHISLTVMSRNYKTNRGKAVSIASLGYSVGEAILPLIVTFFILQTSWRTTAIGSGAVTLLLLLPIFGKGRLEAMDVPAAEVQYKGQKELWKNFGKMIKERTFWILAPAIFILSFITTAIFFYQIIIAQQRGWSVTLYTGFFAGYGIARFFISIIGGQWIDKYGAAKLFKYYLLPLLAGLICLITIPDISGAAIFLFLVGIAQGLSGIIKSAIIAEKYPSASLGAVRSLYTMVMVISTAAGPVLLGHLLDMNMSIPLIFSILTALLIIVIFNNLRKF